MAAYRPQAIRLTLSYDQGEVKLESATPLEMRALPSQEVSGHEQQAGFWVELRDTADQVLYRRVLHNPIRHEVEIYPASPTEQFSRGVVDQPRGSFDVVVPALPGAQAVALFGNLPEPGQRSEGQAALQARSLAAQQAPARLLGRFVLPGAEGR